MAPQLIATKGQNFAGWLDVWLEPPLYRKPLSRELKPLVSEAATMRASDIISAIRLLRKITPAIHASLPSAF